MFIDNEAANEGGAIVGGGYSLEIEDCVFIGNVAASGAAVKDLYSTHPHIAGSTFFANRTTSPNGAAIEGSFLLPERCIVAGTFNGYGIIDHYGGSLAYCCCYFQNEAGHTIGMISFPENGII